MAIFNFRTEIIFHILYVAVMKRTLNLESNSHFYPKILVSPSRNRWLHYFQIVRAMKARAESVCLITSPGDETKRTKCLYKNVCPNLHTQLPAFIGKLPTKTLAWSADSWIDPLMTLSSITILTLKGLRIGFMIFSYFVIISEDLDLKFDIWVGIKDKFEAAKTNTDYNQFTEACDKSTARSC